MKAIVLVLFCTLFGFSNTKLFAQQFNKTDYYNILKAGNLTEINNEMTFLDATLLPDKAAFIGALQMKKAGLLKVPKQKLDNFRKGATKLEMVLSSDTSNVEYRFLRLIIQEHAPNVVKYKSRIKDDATFIKKNYKALSPEVQKILIDYSQTSKALQPQDFES